MPNLFEPRDPSDNPAHASSAAAVFRQPAFKDEVDYGIKSCYQQCIEAIKAKDYVKAEVMHDLTVHLQQFYELFEKLHDLHVQTLKPKDRMDNDPLNQEIQDEDS